MSRVRAVLLCITTVAATSSCFVFRTASVESLTPDQAVGTNVRSPLKAFHNDGTITVFRNGARVTNEAVLGSGVHYSLDLSTTNAVTSVPLDAIVGIEAFRSGISPVPTLLTSALATVGGVALFKAAFGSCPTIYTYEDGAEVLHAEAFSYSIAPLLEARDVDRIVARPDEDGVLRLEVRNEALETHYINHFEILEVRHPAGRTVYSNEDGRIVSVGPVTQVTSALDRDGGVRTAEVQAKDDLVFASTEQRLRAVSASDYWDHVELTFPRPEGESAALVLRLRNSLLTSVLFYDLMLGSRGAEALDWLGTGINRIGEAVELGRWFQERMGLRVAVLGPDGWSEVTRVGDTGPIAWKELAVTVPVPETEELRIRLSFLADEWRIDYAALAADVRRERVEAHQVSAVGPIGGAPDDRLRAQLNEPDEDYLVTTAGTAVFVDFETSPSVPGTEQTFFLSSQGYYTEWMRPEWIVSGGESEGFRASPQAVEELVALWLEKKDAFEAEFYETRIPVR